MSECDHPVQFRGLCAVCFADLTKERVLEKPAKAAIAMTHDSLGVLVTPETAAELERETAKRLKAARKLSLILDLDQTVIHATVDQTVGEWLADDGSNLAFPELKDVHKFTLPGSPTIYYIKLRPGTFDFLAKVSQLYELHIYTMGTRSYAVAVAKIIDPDGSLFNDRILSRDESGSFEQKRVSRIFPGEGEKMAVVVDDRADVWGWCKNLIKVKPCMNDVMVCFQDLTLGPDDFFVGIGDINANPLLDPSKPNATHSSTNSKSNEGNQNASVVTSAENEENVSRSKPSRRPIMHDNDTELELIYDRLSRVHRRFYELVDSGESLEELSDVADVRKILDEMRHQCFGGCEFVFSAVIPMGMDMTRQRHEAYNLATNFGATIATDVGTTTTHVVTAKNGTEKVARGQRSGCFVVKIEWLYHSVHAWKRMPEEVYSLETLNVSQKEAPDEASENPTPETSAELSGVDWQDVDAEIDEAMDDSEEEDGDDADESGGNNDMDNIAEDTRESEENQVGSSDDDDVWASLEKEIEGVTDALESEERGLKRKLEFE
ncbi:Carboxy-terminal domain (CTD) phosphatase [Entophlyctis sp. JEL0112]|nr:Carboxy-terminal domain (CTD) phosphatase [Entophlyctis sp. JEL0112]